MNGVEPAGRQGTVFTFDPADRCGSVVLDDGSEIGFDRAAFDAGGLRLLRPGQRVRIETDPAGRIVLVTIWTLA